MILLEPRGAHSLADERQHQEPEAHNHPAGPRVIVECSGAWRHGCVCVSVCGFSCPSSARTILLPRIERRVAGSDEDNKHSDEARPRERVVTHAPALSNEHQEQDQRRDRCHVKHCGWGGSAQQIVIPIHRHKSNAPGNIMISNQTTLGAYIQPWF